MIDGVIAGNGKSRYLKSAISEDMSWEDFRDALRTGTIPADFSGFNPEGWTQEGTALSKANLLSDATASLIASAYGTTAPETVNEALGDLVAPPIYQKLLSQTVDTAASSISLDLSEIDTEDYSTIEVLASIIASAASSVACKINNKDGYWGNFFTSGSASVSLVNGYADFGGFAVAETTAADVKPSSVRLKIQNAYLPDIPATNSHEGYASIEFSGGYSATAGFKHGAVSVATDGHVESVQFAVASGTILEGSIFEVYGVKK